MNERKSKYRSYITRVLLCCLFVSHASKSWSATDDTLFNECLNSLDSEPGAAEGQAWHNPPLEEDVAKVEDPLLSGDRIVRWTSHINPNGVRTIVVMVRDPNPQLVPDEPDEFDFFIERNGIIKYDMSVDTNNFVFSKSSTHGMSGLWFCTQDAVYKQWLWSGKDWYVDREGNQK